MKNNKRKINPKAIDLFQKQVNSIDKLIEIGYVLIDMKTPLVSIDPYIHLYYTQTVKGDDTALYQGFCTMLRTWINFQRARKKGDLLRMLDARELGSPTPSEPEGGTPPKETETNIRNTWRPFGDEELLRIIVVGHDAEPIAIVEEVAAENRISFHSLIAKEKITQETLPKES